MMTYISTKVFTWPFGIESAIGLGGNTTSRAHDIWRHAKNRINKTPNNDDRADCIASLKKSIDSRVKALRKVYFFDSLPSIKGKNRQLEKLEEYGLVRKNVIKKLFELRNIIEHSDAIPPNLEECHNYIDIVWYFLKSTDDLLSMMTDSLVYESGNNQLNLLFQPSEEWRISVEGNIEEQYLSETHKDGHIALTDAECRPWNDRTMLVTVAGKLVIDNNLKMFFVREYFAAAGYYYEDHI